MMITLVVPGIPAPQGSKNQFGGEASPHVAGWRTAVAKEAEQEMREREIIWGPVEVQVRFVFPRPKKHFHQGRVNYGQLRPDAPTYHSHAPDLDKLQRAIGDALSKIVINDDAQIARWTTAKMYGSVPRAEIRVMLLPTEVAC
jgi:Holliday junction resolvase RusA-like endonuclease